jgi:hypothetical protein
LERKSGALGVRYAGDQVLQPTTFIGTPGANMKRIVVEDCEIVKVADRSRCSELGFEFATLPTRGEVSAFAYSAPVVAIESSSSIGHLTYTRLPVERAITLLTPVFKSTTPDSIAS